jgi:hypothetical protein
MGIHRKVSRNIVFGRTHLGGMALRHLHTLQGIRRTQYLIGRLTNDEGVAKLMRICIEETQLEVGSFEPFLFLLHSLNGPYLISRSWIYEIWYFNDLYHGTITLSNLWLPHPQRTSDKVIIPLALIFTSTKGELIQSNICWLFLQVISISDIYNTVGIHITQQAYDGTFLQNRTNIRWINQRRPYKGGWLTWCRFLHSFSDGKRYIFTPLEKWNDLTKLQHDHEGYIATPRSLIQKRGNQWLLHQRQVRGNKCYASRPSLIHYTPQLKSIAKLLVHRTSI